AARAEVISGEQSQPVRLCFRLCPASAWQAGQDSILPIGNTRATRHPRFRLGASTLQRFPNFPRNLARDFGQYTSERPKCLLMTRRQRRRNNEGNQIMDYQTTKSSSEPSAKTNQKKVPRSAKVRLSDLRPRSDPKGGQYMPRQGSKSTQCG